MRRLWGRAIRYGFRLLYNELAFTYDFVSYSVSLGAWSDWQRAALQFVTVQPGELVLELAHGTGALQIELVRRGYRSIGLDLSASMGQIARKKLSAAEIPVRIVRAHAQALPFHTGSFRTIVSTFPTEFIYEDSTIREIHRVLCPGGEAVIVISGQFEGRGVLRTVLEWLYCVTGQRATQESNILFQGLLSDIERIGFASQVETVACRRKTHAVAVVLTKH